MIPKQSSIIEAHQKEMLSLAHVIAVASKAGVLISTSGLYDYGIDAEIDDVIELDGDRWPRGVP